MYTGLAPRTIVDVARETEAAGWDGFFIWDAFLSDNAWVLLAAAAMVTERVRLGTMLTAPSRRRTRCCRNPGPGTGATCSDMGRRRVAEREVHAAGAAL